MAFCFKRKESVPRGIRRSGRERIESALENLDHWRRAEAIHEARKDIKKLRALLRLVRTAIPRKVRRRSARLLREAAGRLAPPRDAAAEVATLGNLIRHFKGRLRPATVQPLRQALRRAAVEATNRFAREETAKAVRRTLRRVEKELEGLRLSGKGWEALGAGVHIAYRRGRRAYRTACTDGSAENLHQWRKRAKDLWYQVSLLRPVQPGRMDAASRELEALGEALGEDHDLVMLCEAARARCAGEAHAEEMGSFEALIGERRRELCLAALALGARFYAEKPAVFRDRLAGYWHTWRGKEMPCHHAAEGTS